MKIKEWLTKNVNFRRNDTENRNNTGYCATMGAAGFLTGIVTGIIIIILQFAVSEYEAQNTWISVVCGIALLSMSSYLIFMLLPLFTDKSITIDSKVVTTLLSIGCLIGLFIVGIYLTILLFMLVVILFIAWLALKVWASSNSSNSSYNPPRKDNGPKQYTLEDGTTVTENSFTSGYHGSDYNDYERNSDGTFSRVE